jgi:fatty-acyl-CoA synthase
MQLSYCHGTTATPLLGATLGEALDSAARRFGARDALISCHQKLRYSYAELLREANRAAKGLMALGVQRGDRVGIWSPNNAEWTITQYAAAKAGAILVNVNPAYRSRELQHALKHSGVTVLVSARAFRSADYVQMLDELAPALPDLRHLVYLGGSDSIAGMTWADFLTFGDDVSDDELAAREALLQFDDPVNIQYTSGTTGTPKGATLSHHNILNNGYFVGEALHYCEEDRICLPVPFYHCFGCVLGNMAAVTHGCAVVLPGESFDPEATLRAISSERCTSIYGVPTMFIAQLNHAVFDSFCLESLRTGIMAGAPCPVDVMRRVIARMHARDVTIAYGMTETSPVSFQSALDDPIDVRVSTVGRVHPHVECKIIDPQTGAIVPRGTHGELCTRGYLVMIGYWDDAAATACAVDAARWMHTGDLAAMNEAGFVSISGRIDDMIIRGGENIYPREVEELLHTHLKITQAHVIGVPDDHYGEQVCAWVALRDGETATADEVREFCKGRISSYKIPRYVHFTDDFPMTVTGKIQKFRMRQISIEELGLSRRRVPEGRK